MLFRRRCKEVALPGETPDAIHGSDRVAEGRLVGATDTDHFYFLCPDCDGSEMLRILEYYVINEGPVDYAPDDRSDAKRDFLLAFELKCHACGFEDVVKIGNTDWQGGSLAQYLGKEGQTLRWS